ncbi:DNA-directed RNA polymerase subunit beta [Paenibacillus albicereus]|uniref:DNA-directed RNA polymerase subunit beta n=1 Tax=Paenibacillus albicereus TaxID=2726185 RepID=A0A6H2H282_9BACL|nr:DNA-directed RNA polymerase subunit beta [Paenibacillus albicereus]QJC53803.1 DNA-directed RNA polymerase subunit beta [Paenibacillus albicereus]
MTNDTQTSSMGGAPSPRENGQSSPASSGGASRPKEKQAAASSGKPRKKSRFTAWWFARKLIVLALFAGALVGGLYLGFVVVGGGSMSDAFDVATYKHVYDLVFSDS